MKRWLALFALVPLSGCIGMLRTRHEQQVTWDDGAPIGIEVTAGGQRRAEAPAHDRPRPRADHLPRAARNHHDLAAVERARIAVGRSGCEVAEAVGVDVAHGADLEPEAITGGGSVVTLHFHLGDGGQRERGERGHRTRESGTLHLSISEESGGSSGECGASG